MKLNYFMSKKIDKIAKKGNKFLYKREYKKAIQMYKEIIDILPEPKEEWEAYEWANVSIADTYFIMKEYEMCIHYLNKVIQYTNNPFIFLRYGQSYYYESNMLIAEKYLGKAFKIGGKDIFKDEDPCFLDLAKNGYKQEQKKFKNMFHLPLEYQYLEEEYMEMQILWYDIEWGKIYKQYITFFNKIPKCLYDNSMTFLCVSSILESAIHLKKAEDYPKWIEMMEIIAKGRKDEVVVEIWKGICELTMQNPRKAMEYFEVVKKQGGIRNLKNFRHFENEVYDFYINHLNNKY